MGGSELGIHEMTVVGSEIMQQISDEVATDNECSIVISCQTRTDRRSAAGRA